MDTDCFMIFSGQRIRAQQVLERTFIDDLAALTARMRTHVDDMVRDFDDIGIMLHDENGIAPIAQLLQQFIQTMHIARVQAPRWARRTHT